jgi:hypothetical protein
MTVSALFDRENPPRHRPHTADDDTAEIPLPATADPHDPDLGYDPAEADRGRLRPSRARRLKAALLLAAAYTPASLGSTWLLFLALLRLNLPVMLVLTGALAWLVPPTVRLARWLHHPDRTHHPHLAVVQNVAAGVLAGTYAWLFTDWLLHQ